MIKPDAKDQIQSMPNLGKSPEQSQVEDTYQFHERPRRTLAVGAVFGGIVGLPMGAVVGAACCWLTGQFDFLWRGVQAGALAGQFVGGFIGLAERKVRGDLVRPDIATIVCVVLSILPVPLILGGIGLVGGAFKLYSLVGMLFTIPAVGFLIGGILDRAFDAGMRKSWVAATVFSAAGLATCIGLVLFIDAQAYGPAPGEVLREAKGMIKSQLGQNPELARREDQ